MVREQSKRSLDLTIVEGDEIVVPEKRQQEKHVGAIPPKKILNNSNLKKLKSYRQLRQSIKGQNEESEFYEQITAVLNLFDVDEVKYDADLLILVMQIAENYFLGKKDGERRKKNVVLVTKRFFDDNEELTSKIIEMSMDKIVQNKFVKRNLKKCLRYLKSVVVRCLPK